MGQWWGNQSVPMTGIAAVGVAPEYRGSGTAIALVQHTIRELHAQGIPLSVLYPATQRLYRKAGYEQAGTSCGWEIATAAIQPQTRLLPIHALPIDAETFLAPYQQQARLTNGALDRPIAIWRELLKTDEKQSVFAYGFGAIEQLQGYVIFSQDRTDDSVILQIRDWVVLTPAAAQTFWTFLADHRSQIEKVHWKGAAIDPLTLLLPEQAAHPRFIERWMMRVVDVPRALSKRGYPFGVETELHFEIQDDLIPENNGRFVLSVANQQGEITKGGRGDLKLDIRGLVPLYTGLFTPQQLQLAGTLEATETAQLAATQLFAGSSPWMLDFF
jgi:predicted acetyltransferase